MLRIQHFSICVHLLLALILVQAKRSSYAQTTAFDDVRAGIHNLDDVLLEARNELDKFKRAHSARTDPLSELRRQQQRVNSLLNDASEQLFAISETLNNGLKKETIGEAVALQVQRIVKDRMKEIVNLSTRNAAIDVKAVKNVMRPVVNSFDMGNDGWQLTGGKMAVVSSGANRYLQITDNKGPHIMTLTAPKQLSGDLSRFDGGSLSFSAREIKNPDEPYPSFGNVTLVGNNGKVTVDIAQDPLPRTWTTYAIPLTAAAFGTDSDTWSELLKSVERVEIEVECGSKVSEVLAFDDFLLSTNSNHVNRKGERREPEEEERIDAPSVDIAVRDIIANGRKGLLTVRYGNVGRGSVPPTRIRIEVGRRLYDRKTKINELVWEEHLTEPIAGLVPWEHRFFEAVIPPGVYRIRATVDPDSNIAERDEKNNVREEEIEDRGKLAVVVLGDCELGNDKAELRWAGYAQKAALEAKRDLKRAGYEPRLFLLNETSTESTEKKLSNLYFQYIANPELEAFVFIGHGDDNIGLVVGKKDSKGHQWVIEPKDIVKRRGKSAPMQIVLIHSCFQGKNEYKKQWRDAFGVKEGKEFITHKGRTSPTLILKALREWEVPESLHAR